uniref:Uncharacterized protein n=1 Tax=Strigamia maritima TaxID=126957 RepID=T1IV10_STRMM
MEKQDDKMILTNNTTDKVLSMELIILIGVSGGILLLAFIIGIVFICHRMSKSKNQDNNDYNQYRTLRCKNRYSSSDTTPPSLVGDDQFNDDIVRSRLSISHVQPKSYSSSQYHRLSLPAILNADTPETSDDETDAAIQRFSNINGRIWFSIKYHQKTSQLSVTIIKARYLKARGLSHDARDPFVRVYLLPDESNFQQTKCRRRTLSPRFNETFHFQLSSDEISSRTVKISVHDVDKRRIRHLLGHAVVPLDKIDVSSNCVMWRNLDSILKKCNQVGELFFSLCVNTYKHHIKVAILKGRDLHFKHVPITEQTELYIRVEFYYASKLIKFKETTRQKFNENANIFQHFSFSVVGKHIDSYSIILIVMLSIGDTTFKCARVSVGSLLYAHGEELKHWQDMMSNPRTPVERWHFLTTPLKKSFWNPNISFEGHCWQGAVSDITVGVPHVKFIGFTSSTGSIFCQQDIEENEAITTQKAILAHFPGLNGELSNEEQPLTTGTDQPSLNDFEGNKFDHFINESEDKKRRFESSLQEILGFVEMEDGPGVEKNLSLAENVTLDEIQTGVASGNVSQPVNGSQSRVVTASDKKIQGKKKISIFFQNSPYEALMPKGATPPYIIFSNINVSSTDQEEISVSCEPYPQFEHVCDHFAVVETLVGDNRWTGSLVLQKKLPKPAKSIYQVKLVAKSQMSSATTTVTVVIQHALEEALNETILRVHKSRENSTVKPGISKVNLPPRFSSENISISIPEHFPPGSIVPEFELFVSDENFAANAIFNLTVLDPTGLFLIEPVSVYRSTNVSLRINPEGEFDYETMKEKDFVFLVVAIETAVEQPLSSMSVVTVTITDVNDNFPVFEQNSYTSKITENSPVGTFVAKVNVSMLITKLKDRDLTAKKHIGQATDIDSDDFGTAGIRYSLEGDHSYLFQIDANSGEVNVANCNSQLFDCLDFEKYPLLVFTIKATDDNGRGHSSSVSFIVQLIDMNDNSPKFTSPSYRTEIKAGASQFVTQLFVKATDADLSSIVTYTIQDSPVNAFSLDPLTGELTIYDSSKLNVSDLVHHEIQLVIRAQDEDEQYDTATVDISVEDDNLHAPTFEMVYYTANISDEAGPMSPVTQVTAMDKDFASGGHISYRLQYGNDGTFMIDPETGFISVGESTKLDYDKQNVFEIQVLAVDGGIPSQTGTATLVVNISNGNNKPPVFVPQIQKAYLKEESPLGTVVHILSATDPDIKSVDFLKYTIQDPAIVFDQNGIQSRIFKKNKELFVVDFNSGEVKTASSISRTTIAVVVLTTVAMDTSIEPYQTATGTLIISFVGGTKISPIFPLPWTPTEPYLNAKVQEEAPINTFLLSLFVADADSTSKNYKIDPHLPLVKIDSKTGVITTNSRIDYETNETFTFTVKAYDDKDQSRAITANIMVEVSNINDNNPVFEKSAYHFMVEEHSNPGILLGQVKAIDADAGVYGEIKYSILPENNKIFDIDSEGYITTSQLAVFLDREEEEKFVLQLNATDMDPGSSARWTSVSVFVTLTDINDNKPKFVNNEYEVFVIPAKHAGSPIVQLHAIDLDAGINGSVEYSIEEGNEDGLFWVNETSGILYLGSKTTNATSYQIRVAARDQYGKGPNVDYATVSINISEMNSHSPQFLIPYANETEITVLENQQKDLLLQIKAEDLDSGPNGIIQYDFLDNNGDGTNELYDFIIDSYTGEIRVKNYLDRESKKQYQLIIRAKDQGQPHPLESLRVLTVRVLDENDNVPTFPKGPFFSPYSFSVDENAPIRTEIGQVVANDPDEQTNGKIYYQITSGNEDNHFRIDSENGILRTNSILDHEKKNFYQLTIEASNEKQVVEVQKRETDSANDKTNSAIVQIKVKNTNDNPPEFIGLPYQIGVKYSAEVGDFVTRVKAIDPDGGNVTYSLVSSHLYRARSPTSSGAVVPQPFTIDRSGHIFTAASLHFYNQDRFHLTVAAREDSEPFRETKTTAEVWIFEQSQLLRVVVAFPPDIVTQDLPLFVELLSNLTQGKVYVDDIRYHTNKKSIIDKDKTDILIHVVDTSRYEIKSVIEVLNAVDNVFLFHPQYQQLHLTSVEPVHGQTTPEEFNPALIALIALVLVISLGFIIVAIICCSSQKKVTKQHHFTTIVKKERVHAESGPPASAVKLKPYEEQELSMQVFSDMMDQKFGRNPRNPVPQFTSGTLGSASVFEANLHFGDEYLPIEKKPSSDIEMPKARSKKVFTALFLPGQVLLEPKLKKQ